MGDARMDGLSDAGSTPARSTRTDQGDQVKITTSYITKVIYGVVIFISSCVEEVFYIIKKLYRKFKMKQFVV